VADESDGIDETFDGLLRAGLTAAGRVAELIARAREQAAREARAASEQQARELAARLDAERSAARAQLAPVEHAEWWDRAQPADIAQVWETAHAWERLDPDAGVAAERIRREVRDRFGIDVDAPGGDPAAVRAALERRGHAENEAGTQRTQAGRDEGEAARLLAEADRADQPDRADVLEQDSSDSYDTAERRRDLAASLDGVADSETVQAHVVADTFQARPAAEAVADASGPPARARKGHAAARGRGRQRTETLGR
jgi:hypothetical protein